MTAPSQDSRVITFKCPKCGWLYHTSEPISQLDCLGCEARVITEERTPPTLKAVGRDSSLNAAANMGMPVPTTPRIGETCADYRLTPEAIRQIGVCVNKCGLTAAQVTTELRRDGLLPVGWNVVDVSNYIRDWSLRSDPFADVDARLPAGYSAERFDKLLDDDIALNNEGEKP